MSLIQPIIWRPVCIPASAFDVHAPDALTPFWLWRERDASCSLVACAPPSGTIKDDGCGKSHTAPYEGDCWALIRIDHDPQHVRFEWRPV